MPQIASSPTTTKSKASKRETYLLTREWKEILIRFSLARSSQLGERNEERKKENFLFAGRTRLMGINGLQNF